ncbi:metal ABC transporter ATP-binding protein [Sphingobacteriales bacterium UPWRP_1]|nr:manganese ABC transporter ATP-binding protein [Sphingobacteriales bacterium TSM_CSS]PSJ76810.1 metal ABC transporter ATP-binding protein [Sphingobacteriales bacterium UPWRP_1]
MILQADNPAVEVHDLTVMYNKKPALWSVDFSIPGGTLAGIVGPNGAGKSTLIKAMMQLIPASSGYVKLFNQSLDSVRNRVSYVPQRESVDWDFPASVMDVVLMGRYGKRSLLSRLTKADRQIALDSLKKVGMEAYTGRQISQLSGGQQQRVFIARSLAQEADLYFMDEPFAGVDATTEKAILDLLLTMRKEGKTILVVHHDLQSAKSYFDWVIMLNTRLVAAGPKEDVFTPELLGETYGGKLPLLMNVGELAARKDFPVRE